MLKRFACLAIGGCLALPLGAGLAVAGERALTIAPALKPSATMDGVEATDEAEMNEGSFRDLVSDAQRILTLDGFDPGPTDGRLGLRTRSAIQAYQDAARKNRSLADLKPLFKPRPELLGGEDLAPLPGKD
jgi:peptidoglycan hydrolase-like protein with peptidoglycan-binding domain